MKFCKFVEKVKAEAEKLCGDKYEIRVQETLKNNGNVVTGLAFIRRGEDGHDGHTISPIIYLEAYYERYAEGDMPVDNAAGVIVDTAMNCVKRNSLLSSFAADLTDFEKIRGKIYYRLVDYERNQELLKKVPYVPYCNLAVVFHLFLGKDTDSCMTVLITRKQMEVWATDADTLYKLARENTPRIFPPVIMSMNEAMKEAAKSYMGSRYDEEFIDGLLEETASVTAPMHILTNQEKVCGAAVLLYDGLLRKVSEKLGNDLVILPSSRHEVIVMPYKEDTDAAELEEMVKSINRLEVLPEDVLSDSVYRYSRVTDSVHVMSGNGTERQEPGTDTDLEIREEALMPGCAV